MVINWSSFFRELVVPLSSGLALSFTNHGRENVDKFTMAPRTVSPVEGITFLGTKPFYGNIPD